VGEVVNDRRLFATTWISARMANQVHVDQSARIETALVQSRSEAQEKGNALGGRVAFVGRVADAQTGNLPVRVLVENPTGLLAIGQTVHVTIVIGQRAHALAVPLAAIHGDGDSAELRVVRDGKAVVLHPTLGIVQSGWVEVTGIHNSEKKESELKEGEPVVVEGSYNLPEDTKVKVESANAGDESSSHR
jgi:multidrug efflux pump subunit AcrA (membrane-fusion protein)